jgi:hypothetical protein
VKDVRFKEVLTGRLVPQTFDASDSYGGANAIAASLHASIDIRDLDVFIANKDRHGGRLRGTVVIPVLGAEPFVAHGGVFELFRPGRNPTDGGAIRLMVYDAFLTGNGRVYMMRGRKYLEPKWMRPLRLWRETTTLDVEVRDVTHGGRVDGKPSEKDALGGGQSFEEIPSALRAKIAPVGQIPPWLETKRLLAQENGENLYLRDFGRPRYLSGVLRLSPSGLFQLAFTMQATGVPLYRRPFAIARFIVFFARSLARIYLLRDRSH